MNPRTDPDDPEAGELLDWDLLDGDEVYIASFRSRDDAEAEARRRLGAEGLAPPRLVLRRWSRTAEGAIRARNWIAWIGPDGYTERPVGRIYHLDP